MRIDRLGDFVKLRLLYRVAARLPPPVAYRLASLGGAVDLWTRPDLRAAVRLGLAEVYGHLDGARRLDLFVREHFAVRACDDVEALAVHAKGWPRLRPWLRVSGGAHATEATRTGAALLLTFHYGAGGLVFGWLRDAGIAACYLSAPLANARHETRERLELARIRLAGIRKLTGNEIVFAGGSLSRLREMLRGGVSVVGLLDVPPGALSARGFAPVRLFGRQAWLPTGLLRLAAEQGCPVVPFVGVLDQDWRRHIRFDRPFAVERVETALAALAGRLEALIQQAPAEWHFWAGLDRFFMAPPSETVDGEGLHRS